jgi:threonine/homoserine/homoserine lactone efflux protein
MSEALVVLGPIVLATVLPGPSMLLALDHGSRYGSRRATATALGNVTATLLQVGAVVATLETVTALAPWTLALLRLGGALYLAWLGLQACRVAGSGTVRRDSGLGGSGRFWQAVLVTLGNPSAMLFFMALFPRFLGQGRAWLALHLVLPMLAITFAAMMLYARFGQTLVQVLGQGRAGRAGRLVLGVSFLAMGGWLGWHG